VSGTSAGSIVGAIVAAASKHEHMTGEQVKQIALSLNYRKFPTPAASNASPFSVPPWQSCGATASTGATTPTVGSAVS
jgi:NTE family protein